MNNNISKLVAAMLFAGYLFVGMPDANPRPMPYEYPFISEVRIFDSTNWSIELDRSYLYSTIMTRKNISIIPGVACTTSGFQLRFASNRERYPIRFIFDSLGIGIVSRESILGLPINAKVSVNTAHDTINIIDTVSTSGVEARWRMPIESFSTYKSRINSGLNSNPNIGICNSRFFGSISPASYDSAFIDEVYAKDSLQWQIELNGNRIASRLPHFPATVQNFMVRFGSSPTRYAIQVQFDSSGFGVVSRSSIQGVSANQQIPINMHHDTVMIIDTVICGIERAYRLPIDTFIPGKSIIYGQGAPNSAYAGLHSQWERPSIGRRNGTLYMFNFVDSAGAPYYNADVYAMYMTWELQHKMLYGKTNNKNARIPIILDPYKISDSLWFTSTNLDTCRYSSYPARNDSIWLGFCEFYHSDSADTLFKTVLLKDKFAIKYFSAIKRPAAEYSNSFSGTQIGLITYSNRSVSLVVSLSNNARNAFVKIYNAGGRQISSVKINNNGQKGTFSIPGNELFAQGIKKIKGAYMCEVITDGVRAASKLVVVP